MHQPQYGGACGLHGWKAAMGRCARAGAHGLKRGAQQGANATGWACAGWAEHGAAEAQVERKSTGTGQW